jgi:hypothetical protein
MPIGHCSDLFTTLCDGIPRAVCPVSSTTTAVWLWHGSSILRGQPVTTRPETFPISKPNCDIEPLDCNRLANEMAASWSQQYTLLKPSERKLKVMPFGCNTVKFSPFWDSQNGLNQAKNNLRIDEEYVFRNDLSLPAIPMSSRLRCLSCRPSTGIDVDMLFWTRRNVIVEDIVCPESHSHVISTSSYISEYTTIFHGNTLIYPTPYAFFPTYMVEHCGTTRYNVAVPLESAGIRTQSLNPSNKKKVFEGVLTPEHWSVKTVTVNGTIRTYPLIPYSAYFAQKGILFKFTAETIYNDYIEMIDLQMDGRKLYVVDKQWRFCNTTLDLRWIDPPIWLTPEFTNSLSAASLLHPASTSAIVSSSDIQAPTPVPLPGPSIYDPYPPATPVAANAPSFPTQSRPGAPENRPRGSTIQVKPTTHMVSADVQQSLRTHDGAYPQAVDRVSLHGSGGMFSHGVQDLVLLGWSASYDLVASQWLYVETKAVFSVYDAGMVTASQVKPGVYALEGTTFSKGGTAITFHGSIITAYESGVVVLDDLQSTGVGGQPKSSGDGGKPQSGSSVADNDDSGNIGQSDDSNKQVSAVPSTRRRSGDAILGTNRPLLLLVLSIFLIKDIVMDISLHF